MDKSMLEHSSEENMLSIVDGIWHSLVLERTGDLD